MAMLSQNTYQRQHIVIALVCSLLGILIAVLYYLLRIGFEYNFFQDVINSAGLACFIILLPTVLFLFFNRKGSSPVMWYSSDAFFTIIVIGILGLAGFMMNDPVSGLLRLLVVVACMLGSIVLYYYLRFHARWKHIWFGLLTAAFGVFLGFQFWGGEYHNPLFIEKIALGTAHADTLFHVTIANMIRTFHFPGNGIDNQAYLSYHW